MPCQTLATLASEAAPVAVADKRRSDGRIPSVAEGLLWAQLRPPIEASKRVGFTL